MSEARELPARIAVVGDGQVGAIAAIMLRRALPATEIVVVSAPLDPAALADQAMTALPFTNRLHDSLGIAEDLLVRDAGASHRLVTQFRGWAGPEHNGFAPYGAALDPQAEAAFETTWGSGPRIGTGDRPVGSLAEALALAMRFAPPSGAPDDPLREVDFALRWSAPAYRQLLVRMAQQLGIQHAGAGLVDVRSDGAGGIAAISLASGEELSADLYLDCTGPAALLLSRLPDYRTKDWTRRLPVRQLILTRPNPPLLALHDRITLTPFGWVAEVASRDGHHVSLALPEAVDAEAVCRALELEPVLGVALRPGRPERAWLGNVIAIGDAAARFEPLAWLNLDFAHRQLALLMEMLPGRQIDPRERDEFNRRNAQLAEGVCDLLGSIYAASSAEGIYDRQVRSATLDHALDQFARRGRLPFQEEFALETREWTAWLHAVGINAGRSAVGIAQAGRVAGDVNVGHAARIAAGVAATPPYAQWLDSFLNEIG